MEFHIGDPVMHWTYGLGSIIGIEERNILGQNQLYYAVGIKDLTVWVPADAKVDDRLRRPTPAAAFKRLFSILAGPGEPLPENRQERKTQIVERLKDGRADSLCHVIRDLSDYEQARRLNETDQSLMRRARDVLLGEWGFVLSVSIWDAEKELRRILTSDISAQPVAQ